MICKNSRTLIYNKATEMAQRVKTIASQTWLTELEQRKVARKEP